MKEPQQITILIHCEQHGLIAIPAPFALDDGASVSFINVATPCPNCGESAEILEGRYALDREQLQFLASPNISSQQLNALKELLTSVAKGTVDPEQSLKEAENIAPGFISAFNVSKWSEDNRTKILAAVIGAVTTIILARTGADALKHSDREREPVVIEKSEPQSWPEKTDGRIPIPTPRPKKRH